LDSLNDEFSAGARRAFGVDGRGSDQVSRTDALLYLTPHPGDSDRRFVEELREAYEKSGLSGVSSVGVLSRIDMLSPRPGLIDPWPKAREVADNSARKLRRSLRTVIPIVGLLAETALGGVFSERDAAAVVRLAKRPRREQLLSSVAALRAATSDDAEAVERLLRQLQMYGLSVAFGLVDEGARTAVHLLRGFRAASGIDALCDLLDGDFLGRADLMRSEAALVELERSSYRGAADDRAATQTLRSDIEAIRLRPDFQLSELLRLLRRIALGDVVVSRDRERELLRFAAGRSPAEAVGLSADASTQEVRERATQLWTTWRELENDMRVRSQDRAAARTFRGNLERLLIGLSSAGTFAGAAVSTAATAGDALAQHPDTRRPA
jgi:hypothetical protein